MLSFTQGSVSFNRTNCITSVVCLVDKIGAGVQMMKITTFFSPTLTRVNVKSYWMCHFKTF